MKGWGLAAVAIAALALCGPVWASAPPIQAPAYVVQSSVDGRTLAARSADTPRPMASITKLMTVLVALPRLPLDRVVTVPAAAARVGESSLDLRAGQRVPVRDLVIGALVPSANDAATALAVAAGGSVPRFVALMNRKARELGLSGTRYRNPHGLDEAGHVSTARDVAMLLRVREKGFVRVWGTMLRHTIRQNYDLVRMQSAHPLRDAFWEALTPDLSAIDIPMLVCGSFSDQALHSRGSFRAFTTVASLHARVYTHRGGKWSTFYSEPARAEQLAFFRDVLDGRTPATRTVRLEVREDRDTIAAVREETEWPLARTQWTPLYLAAPGRLDPERPAIQGCVTFATRSRAAAFSWTIAEDIELTGPMSARSSARTDLDDVNLFIGVEKWRDGRYVGFEGSFGYGRDRVATGWQRAALRSIDPQRSATGEPVPTLNDPQPLSRGHIVAVTVALGPSATVFRARGNNYDWW